MNQQIVIAVPAIAIFIMFAIAYFVDRLSADRKAFVGHPVIYSLSLGVFVTGVSFFSMVGWAGLYGIRYYAIFYGAIFSSFLFWIIQRKFIQLNRSYKISSIADFLSSRYGKSSLLGSIVTLFYIFAVLPYISTQFRGIAENFDFLVRPDRSGELQIFNDTSFYVAILLSIFAILFGTRNIDSSKRHEGVVASVAFHSLFKLVVFLNAAVYIINTMSGGFFEIFKRANESGAYKELFLCFFKTTRC